MEDYPADKVVEGARWIEVAWERSLLSRSEDSQGAYQSMDGQEEEEDLRKRGRKGRRSGRPWQRISLPRQVFFSSTSGNPAIS